MAEVKLSDRLTVSIEEAAALTGIGTVTLREWARNDISFPACRVGSANSKMIISVKLLQEYLDRKTATRQGCPQFAHRIAAITANEKPPTVGAARGKRV